MKWALGEKFYDDFFAPKSFQEKVRLYGSLQSQLNGDFLFY